MKKVETEEENMSTVIALLCVCLLTVSAHAAVKTETVEYKAGDTLLKGYLAYDDSVKGERPGVLVVHEWTGLGEHPKASARKLAGLGYIALAVDMYGEGKLTSDTGEAARLSSEIKNNPDLLNERFSAAMGELGANPLCDRSRIAAIGYCFGGTVVLEMARMGADLAAVVSFHGGLGSNVPKDDRGMIRAMVLACHGADDPHVPPEEVQAFQDEMREAAADWVFISYGNAVHSFTNPRADSESARYNEKAARRSWEAMKSFLSEAFAE
jgi:dienelactone hydrolase